MYVTKQSQASNLHIQKGNKITLFHNPVFKIIWYVKLYTNVQTFKLIYKSYINISHKSFVKC